MDKAKVLPDATVRLLVVVTLPAKVTKVPEMVRSYKVVRPDPPKVLVAPVIVVRPEADCVTVPEFEKLPDTTMLAVPIAKDLPLLTVRLPVVVALPAIVPTVFITKLLYVVPGIVLLVAPANTIVELVRTSDPPVTEIGKPVALAKVKV